MTPAGIEPTTFRLVAHDSTNCATACPIPEAQSTEDLQKPLFPRKDVTQMPAFCMRKNPSVSFFLSLHYPHNRLENSSILPPPHPLQLSIQKAKTILRYKKILAGHLPPWSPKLQLRVWKLNELFSEGNAVCVFSHSPCAASVMYRKPTRYVTFQLPSTVNKLHLLEAATYPAWEMVPPGSSQWILPQVNREAESSSCAHLNNNNIHSIYLLQLCCHPVAVVILRVYKIWKWLIGRGNSVKNTTIIS